MVAGRRLHTACAAGEFLVVLLLVRNSCLSALPLAGSVGRPGNHDRLSPGSIHRIGPSGEASTLNRIPEVSSPPCVVGHRCPIGFPSREGLHLAIIS